MKKRLIGLTERQDHILQELSEDLGIPISEIFRRVLDNFIDNLLDAGDLVKFRITIYDSDKTFELPKSRFNTILEFVKSHIESIEIKETES